MHEPKSTTSLIVAGVVAFIIIFSAVAYFTGIIPGIQSPFSSSTSSSTNPNFLNLFSASTTPSSGNAGTITSSGKQPTIPSSGMYLGVHVDPGKTESVSEGEFTALESSLGRTLGIDSEYYNWNELGNADNTARTQWDTQHGRLSMLSWRPLLTKNPDQTKDTCASANDILSGKYDAQIKQQANTLKGYGVPLLLRWNYEMTGNEYNYCFNNGSKVNSANYAKAGAAYVAVWKHIVDIFRAEGVTNVAWVWAPSATLFSNPDGSANTTDWKLFYPGSDYVDWIGDDRYNKGDTVESFATDTNIKNFYDQMSVLGKPLMQTETGANADPRLSPDPQTEWLTTLYSAMKTQYPAFKGLVYWDSHSSSYYGGGPKPNSGIDYLLIGPGLAAFKQMANDPYFKVMQQ